MARSDGRHDATSLLHSRALVYESQRLPHCEWASLSYLGVVCIVAGATEVCDVEPYNPICTPGTRLGSLGCNIHNADPHYSYPLETSNRYRQCIRYHHGFRNRKLRCTAFGRVPNLGNTLDERCLLQRSWHIKGLPFRAWHWMICRSLLRVAINKESTQFPWDRWIHSLECRS
jgi:hypothetical protein